MPRAIAALSAAVLAVVALAGCTVETETCKDSVCTIKLRGANASTTLGGEGGDPVTLLGADGKTAKLKIGSDTGTLTVGTPVTLDNATLELTEVKGKDSVVLKLRGTEGSSSSSPDASSPGSAD